MAGCHGGLRFSLASPPAVEEAPSQKRTRPPRGSTKGAAAQLRLRDAKATLRRAKKSGEKYLVAEASGDVAFWQRALVLQREAAVADNTARAAAKELKSLTRRGVLTRRVVTPDVPWGHNTCKALGLPKSLAPKPIVALSRDQAPKRLGSSSTEASSVMPTAAGSHQQLEPMVEATAARWLPTIVGAGKQRRQTGTLWMPGMSEKYHKPSQALELVFLAVEARKGNLPALLRRQDHEGSDGLMEKASLNFALKTGGVALPSDRLEILWMEITASELSKPVPNQQKIDRARGTKNKAVATKGGGGERRLLSIANISHCWQRWQRERRRAGEALAAAEAAGLPSQGDDDDDAAAATAAAVEAATQMLSRPEEIAAARQKALATEIYEMAPLGVHATPPTTPAVADGRGVQLVVGLQHKRRYGTALQALQKHLNRPRANGIQKVIAAARQLAGPGGPLLHPDAKHEVLTCVCPKCELQRAQAWGTTLDPRTGKHYYHNAITGKAQWQKPDTSAARQKEKEWHSIYGDGIPSWVQPTQAEKSGVGAGAHVEGLNWYALAVAARMRRRKHARTICTQPAREVPATLFQMG